MYEFLTGPMLWAAFLIFVIGLARRVVLYIRGLDWRLERVAYGPGRKIGMKGAISSVLQWLVPFGTHSWRRQPYFTIAFFLFHIGVVIVPLFLAGHMVIMQERFGFSLPSLPMWFSDAFTVLAIVGAFMMILRRVALPEVRFLTTLVSCCWCCSCSSPDSSPVCRPPVMKAGSCGISSRPSWCSFWRRSPSFPTSCCTSCRAVSLAWTTPSSVAARRAAPLSPGNPPGLPAYWRTTCLKASFATDGPSTPRKI